MDSADILLFNEQLDHIAMLLQYILYAICVFIVLIVLSFCIKPYWKTQEELERSKQIVRDQRKVERDEFKKRHNE